MRKIVQSYFRNGSLMVKLVTKKDESEESKKRVFGSHFKERACRLLVREDLSSFIVDLNACEDH